MNLSAAQAAALLLAMTVIGVLGTMSGLGNTHAVAESNRLTEIATSVADATANFAKTGGSVTADSYTISDTRLGSVQVTVAPSGNVIAVTASADGLSQQAQAEVQ